jgi:hypothetical protein
MDTVRKELKAKGFTDAEIDLGGFKVITTFDKRSQTAAVKAVRQERPTIKAKGVHIGLSAVEAGTGGSSRCTGVRPRAISTRRTQARDPAGLALQGVRALGGAAGRHQSQEPVPGHQPYKVPGTDAEVNNEFNSRTARRRPRQGNRGLHQHGVRRPGGADGTAEGRRRAIAAGIPEDTPG